MKGKNIILIGFMGSGKTSVGKILSEKLNYDFKDTDEMIETLEDTTINNIFRLHGEEFFRDLETTLLLSLKDTMRNTVLSTGGGMPVRESNRKILKEMGQVVFLRASADSILKRLSGDTTRPLLKNKNPKETAERLLAQRTPYYEEAADVIIDTDNKAIDDIVGEILNAIK
ncbi:shikimate kinase [Herbinix hemicellulosilytica]|uniref:Shikimate kinase n=1 Tax=Herbinix hemicellulosilytica TaxID=1564487 RepID=A0A0H5SE39_HERHM|nr:shikimate kinase [Herbinix hemicellulosilytica]RBP57587.1 shikimate kinase [Herbinix hemicellulosilytica]CRZ33669.1 hypothetical protein HHT355_0464 [Herbinix hemicellulosilytica]